MLILGIETATERIGVAVIGSDGVISAFEATRSRHHAEIVMPAIDFVCRQGGVSVDELSAIAVDIGPGLFTGMRVGLATGQAMAQALDVPMVAVTSLETLAYSVRHTDTVIASVVDARKGQVFYGFHHATGDGVVSASEPRAGSVADLIAAIEDRGQRALCVGDGTVRYRTDLEGHTLIDIADRHHAFPSVHYLAIIAMRRALREQWSSPTNIRAMYLRAPDAEINWSTRDSSPPAVVRP